MYSISKTIIILVHVLECLWIFVNNFFSYYLECFWYRGRQPFESEKSKITIYKISKFL